VFEKITTFIFDVDGVLTDGTVLLVGNGLQARRMSIKDGLALQMAVKNGYRVQVISGGDSPEVKSRLQKLGIADVRMSVMDKSAFVATLMQTLKLDKDQVLYMGDDLPDLPVMDIVGLSSCPADAVPEIKAASRYISPLPGGAGCVRDVIEKVLRINGHWHYRHDVASR
jgi:3-deoxy-D-manno-octulosonate 8-phosphate phosphatase (KDO 8-P phosphatase)